MKKKPDLLMELRLCAVRCLFVALKMFCAQYSLAVKVNRKKMAELLFHVVPVQRCREHNNNDFHIFAEIFVSHHFNADRKRARVIQSDALFASADRFLDQFHSLVHANDRLAILLAAHVCEQQKSVAFSNICDHDHVESVICSGNCILQWMLSAIERTRRLNL